MDTTHYKDELSAYTNGEMAPDEQIVIRDHVAGCSECRTAYDEIAFGAQLANQLRYADAPDAIWANVVDKLDGKPQDRFALIQSN